MTKTVKKRLQAVVALLVSLVIMVGIMPSGIVQVVAYTPKTKYTIYYERNGDNSVDASSNHWSDYGDRYVSAWDDNGHSTGGLKKMTQSGNSYSYTLDFTPTGFYFSIESSWTNNKNQTIDIHPGDFTLTDQNTGLQAQNGSEFRAVNDSTDGKHKWYVNQQRGGTSISPNYGSSGDSSQNIPTGTKTVAQANDTENGTYFLADTTLIDYYSDYELQGNQRKDSNTGEYIQAVSLDCLLSDWYESNSIERPIYFGHFDVGLDNDWFYNGSLGSGDKRYYYMMSYNESKARVGGSSGNETFTNNANTSTATQGLYKDTLVSGNIALKGSSVVAPFFNTTWLRGGNDKSINLAAVYNTKFPFKKNSTTGNWEYDSKYVAFPNGNALRLKKTSDSSAYYLEYTGGNIKSSMDTYGLFPFNDSDESGNFNKLNYGFGMKMTIPFSLNADGTDKNGNSMKFEFSGDDDLLVYIDGKLALDIGGAHGAVSGSIDFSTDTSTVSRAVTAGVPGASDRTDTTGTYNSGTVTYGTDGVGASTKKGDHTMTIFYMERGLFESNCKITFNMIVPEQASSRLDIQKEVDTQTTGTNNMWVTSGGAVASGGSADLAAVKTLYENNLKSITFDVRAGFCVEGTGGAGTGNYPSGYSALTSTDIPTYNVVQTSDTSTVLESSKTATAGTGYNTFTYLKDNRTAVWEGVLDVSNLGYRVQASEDSTKRIDFAGNTANKTVADLFSGSWKYTDRVHETKTGSNFGPVEETTGTGWFKWEGTKNYPETIKFTNTVRTSGIQITKVLSEKASTSKTFSIKVTLSNLGGMDLEDVYTDGTKTTDNTITITKSFTVTASQLSSSTVTIDGIPAGTTFAVEEIAPFDTEYSTPSYAVLGAGTATSNGVTGTLVAGAGSVVTVTNTKSAPPAQQVSLKLQKVWTYDMSGQMAFTSVKFKLQKQNGSTWEDVADYTLSTASGNDHVTAVTTTVDGRQQTVWTRDTAIQVDSGGTYRILEYADGNTALILETDGIYAFQWKAKYNTTGTYQNQKTLSANGDLAIVNDFTNMTTGMPKTGARGVYAIVTFGAFAITIAGVALLIYRKKLQTVNIYAVKGSEKPKE